MPLEDFRLFTAEGWEKRFASNIPSVLQNTLTHIDTPAMHKDDTLEGQHLLLTHIRDLMILYNTIES